MKLKGLIFLLSLSVLAFITFVDNIPINIGDEHTYISQDEWYESNHPRVNNFCEIGKEEKSGLIDLNDFYLYLNEISGNTFYKHDISYLDTTGDGKNEKVHSIVKVVNQECRITNYIEKNNEVIWKDELTISMDMAASFIGSSVLLDNYGPYLLYYLGEVKSRFTEKLEQNHLFDQRKKDLLRRQNKGQSLDALYESSLSQSMENYKGLYLFRMNEGQKGIYMWDKEKSEFICIYQNDHILS